MQQVRKQDTKRTVPIFTCDILKIQYVEASVETLKSTFTVELDNMDRMLMQIELTVIAGDQES